MKNLLKNKKILGLIAIAVVILFLSTRSSNNVKHVTPYTVDKREVVKNISSSGETTSAMGYTYKAPVTAKISKINKLSGEPVKAGDIVLTFDQKSLKASYDSSYSAYLASKNDFDSYNSNLESAKRKVDDTKFKRDQAMEDKMSDNNDTTKEALKTAEYNYQVAVSALEQLRNSKKTLEESANAAYSSYILAQDNLYNTYAKSNGEGFVALETINPGDLVTTGQKLFSIVSKDKIEFIAEVDETDIENIKLEQPVKITIDAFPNDVFDGIVKRIDAKTKVTSSGSTIVETAINLDLADHKPIVGMSGTADIEVGKEVSKVAVPFDSVLFSEDGKSYVFVIDSKLNTVQKREIQLGFEGNDYYVVKEGVSEGEEIVIGNEITELTDGSKISVNKAK